MLLSFDFGTFLHKKPKVSNMFCAKSKQDVHFSRSSPDYLPTRDIFANIIIESIGILFEWLCPLREYWESGEW